MVLPFLPTLIVLGKLRIRNLKLNKTIKKITNFIVHLPSEAMKKTELQHSNISFFFHLALLKKYNTHNHVKLQNTHSLQVMQTVYQ